MKKRCLGVMGVIFWPHSLLESLHFIKLQIEPPFWQNYAKRPFIVPRGILNMCAIILVEPKCSYITNMSVIFKMLLLSIFFLY